MDKFGFHILCNYHLLLVSKNSSFYLDICSPRSVNRYNRLLPHGTYIWLLLGVLT